MDLKSLLFSAKKTLTVIDEYKVLCYSIAFFFFMIYYFEGLLNLSLIIIIQFIYSIIYYIFSFFLREGHVCLTDDDKDKAKNNKGSLLYGELLPRGANKVRNWNFGHVLRMLVYISVYKNSTDQ